MVKSSMSFKGSGWICDTPSHYLTFAFQRLLPRFACEAAGTRGETRSLVLDKKGTVTWGNKSPTTSPL